MSLTPKNIELLAAGLKDRCAPDPIGPTWGEARAMELVGIEKDPVVDLNTAFYLGSCPDKADAEAKLELARQAEIEAIDKLKDSNPESLASIISNYKDVHAAFLAAKVVLQHVLALQGS